MSLLKTILNSLIRVKNSIHTILSKFYFYSLNHEDEISLGILTKIIVIHKGMPLTISVPKELAKNINFIAKCFKIALLLLNNFVIEFPFLLFISNKCLL